MITGCNIGCKTLLFERGMLPLKLTCPAYNTPCPATPLNKGEIGLCPKHCLPSGASQGLVQLAPLPFFAKFTCDGANGYVARRITYLPPSPSTYTPLLSKEYSNKILPKIEADVDLEQIVGSARFRIQYISRDSDVRVDLDSSGEFALENLEARCNLPMQKREMRASSQSKQ